MTFKSNIISERQRAVIETMRMRLTEKQALAYLKEVGFEMSDTTWYREKNKLEKMKLKRLYHIAQIGFQDQHLETIDQYEMGFKMMWQNVLREQNPYRQNIMIKDILLLKPYLSAYYEATKLIIDKQQPEYQEFLDKQLQQHKQEEQEEQQEARTESIKDSDDDDDDNKNRKFQFNRSKSTIITRGIYVFMSRAKRYTNEQKHLIKQCMIDADIMGLGKLETIAYVKGRLGLT